MPDNPSSAAQPDSGPAPAELNFDQPPPESPRIKRRSLKAKSNGMKPATAPPAARDLEREAPPRPAETAGRAATVGPETKQASTKEQQPPTKTSPVAPPRTKPTISLTSTPTASVAAQRPAAQAASTSANAVPKSVAAPTATAKTTSPAPTTASPHGTRPATLYYSSYPRKDTTAPMKTNSTASPAASSTPSSSSSTGATAARPVTATAAGTAPRTAAPIDYRANVERQSREQKSVGNLLSYIVYGMIFLFLAGAVLAGYGGKIIFDKLHDQSATISDVDSKYALANQEFKVQLTAEQDTITQIQAQNVRQQDLINKQEEEITSLRAAIADSTNAIKAETKARTQETAVLRARLRDLESRNGTSQKY